MEVLEIILQVLLYLLGAGLLTVLIIAVVKLFATIDKVNKLLDDLEDKSQTLNGLFDTIEDVSDTAKLLNNRVTNVVSKFLGATRKRRRKIEEEDEYE